MPNHLLIYVIVALNAVCQTMLIWRLRLDKPAKLIYCVLTLAVPVVIALLMRSMIFMGLIHQRVAEQSGVERFFTSSASILLIVAPLLVTAAAIATGKKRRYPEIPTTG